MEINLNWNWDDESDYIIRASGNLITAENDIGIFETGNINIDEYNNTILSNSTIKVITLVYKRSKLNK